MLTNPDPSLIALGIQQPWAELILRGIKTIEVRRVPTQIRGTIYLYASKRLSSLDAARQMLNDELINAADLPFGLLVGTVDIVECRPSRQADAASACVPESYFNQTYSWVLENARRCPEPLPVRYVPFGMWFYPYRRLEATPRRRRKDGGV